MQPETTADAAGLRPGDVILRAGQTDTGSPDDLQRVLSHHPIGAPLVLEVLRDGRRLSVVTQPTELPNDL